MIYSDFDSKKQILISRFEDDVSLKEITDYIDAAVKKLIDFHPTEKTKQIL